MSELGQMLRETRESKGISLVEAEEATRIRRKYLQALEDANYEALPPGVYVRGFLRNYASYLGLDPEQTLASYQDGVSASNQLSEPTIISEPLSPSPPINWEIVAGLVMLAALGVVLVLVYREYIAPLAGGFISGAAPAVTETTTPAETETPSLAALLATNTPAESPTPAATATTPAPPTSTPAPSATPTQALEPTVTPTTQVANPQQDLTLTLSATAPSWVRMDLDGETVFQGILDPGDQQTWQAQGEISMRTGNAGGLTATLNDQDIGVLGDSGQVLDFIWRLSETGEIITVTPTP